MRIHTNTLTTADVYAAIHGGPREAWDKPHPAQPVGTRPANPGALPGVHVEVTAHGSRTHTRSLDIHLTGTSPRRTNAGCAYPSREGAGTDYAATWDEWGMVLARLFDADPDAVVGTVKRPIYRNRAHFHWATGDRYLVGAVTPETQHKLHRWDYDGESVTGAYTVHRCSLGKSACGAIRRMGRDYYLAEEFPMAGVRVGA